MHSEEKASNMKNEIKAYVTNRRENAANERAQTHTQRERETRNDSTIPRRNKIKWFYLFRCCLLLEGFALTTLSTVSELVWSAKKFDRTRQAFIVWMHRGTYCVPVGISVSSIWCIAPSFKLMFHLLIPFSILLSAAVDACTLGAVTSRFRPTLATAAVCTTIVCSIIKNHKKNAAATIDESNYAKYICDNAIKLAHHILICIGWFLLAAIKSWIQ